MLNRKMQVVVQPPPNHFSKLQVENERLLTAIFTAKSCIDSSPPKKRIKHSNFVNKLTKERERQIDIDNQTILLKITKMYEKEQQGYKKLL